MSIDERPAIVDERSRIGDVEIDTVIGARGGEVLVTAVERKSGLLFINKSADKTRANVCGALIDLLIPIKDSVKTITVDNGREFSFHIDRNKLFPFFYLENDNNKNFYKLINV